MTLEALVGVVFSRPVVGKMILSYICLPFHLPTQASQLTGTSSYYRFRCHYPSITYLRLGMTWAPTAFKTWWDKLMIMVPSFLTVIGITYLSKLVGTISLSPYAPAPLHSILI